MNPGPVLTDPRVRNAMAGADVCHREAEFADLMARVADKLVAVADGDRRHAAVLLTGSGTAALEAAVGSVVPPDGRLLVLDNGHYGDRLHRIATALGVPVRRMRGAEGHRIDLDEVARLLSARHPATHVALVHHETSSGVLNPLRPVVRLAHEAGAQVVVDAISSFGAEPLSLREDEVDWVVGSSNKCLEGVPGLSFVIGARNGFDALPTDARSFYLDLRRHYAAQYHAAAPAFTPAVPACYALDAALGLVIAETPAGRHARYARLAAVLRDGLGRLGLNCPVPEDERSVCLTVFPLPPGVSYTDLHHALKTRGFVIYAGQAGFARDHFRLSTMGQMTAADVDGFLRAFREVLAAPQARGDEHTPGGGVG
ncbi:2-aminoethylphosphonate aminotransferase [Streptomyces sp. NPDC050560]|uniref:2-aminoethylphosphonate aminotransferase n=1 Tax=Streptomyces sp. NPDC050560 TaxID=3365630 RepID=UPI00378DB4D4